MEKPLVSIVTITRNRGYLLGRCIKSVLEQTYKNIEHIVVDGASDDNTDDIIKEFLDDKRFRFVKLDYNWPIKETLDHGISLCNGKFISFLDSDDEYVPTKIEKQVSLFETLPEDYGFIYCWMTYFDNNTHEVIRCHKTELRGFVSDKVLGSPILSGTPTLMFRAETIRDLDGWKSMDEIGIVSDWELCARACQKYKVDYVPESLVNVYVNHSSVRQSESRAYYNNQAERLIKFHLHFLREFKDTFDHNPKLAQNHYYELTQCYSELKKRGEALNYLRKYSIGSRKFGIIIKLFIKILLGR